MSYFTSATGMFVQGCSLFPLLMYIFTPFSQFPGESSPLVLAAVS